MNNPTDRTVDRNTKSAARAASGIFSTRISIISFWTAVMAALTLTLTGPSAFGIVHSGAQNVLRPSSQTPRVTGLERVNAYVQPSVVYIALEWTGWVYDTYNKGYLNDGELITLTFQCTGFVVNPDGYIATAGHCVDPKLATADFVEAAATWAVDHEYYANPDLTVADIVAFDDFRVEGEASKRRPDLDVRAAWSASAAGVEIGKALPARVITYQPFGKGDAALLKVQASGLNAIKLQGDGDVRVGTQVVAVGYPGSVDAVTDADFSASYKDGSISSLKTVDGGLLPVYEISAAVSGGMSGGPTVDLQGRVIGLNSFGIEGEQQPFNFVRPAQMLAEILAGAGVENEPSTTDRQYRLGLEAYFAGDRSTAIKAMRAVVREQPTHELAQDYLVRARGLPVPMPAADDETNLASGPALGAIAGLALLALAAASVLKYRSTAVSRRRPDDTPMTATATATAPVHAATAAPEEALYGGSRTRPVVNTDGHALPSQPPRRAGTLLLEEAEGQCPSCHSGTTATQQYCGNCGSQLGPRP